MIAPAALSDESAAPPAADRLSERHSSRLCAASWNSPPAPVTLKNPLGEERSVMRTTLLPGLLEALQRSRRHGVSDVRLFTVGARVTKARRRVLTRLVAMCRRTSARGVAASLETLGLSAAQHTEVARNAALASAPAAPASRGATSRAGSSARPPAPSAPRCPGA